MEKIKLKETYIKKGSKTGETFVPISINNNIVKFSNSGQCLVEKFHTIFEHASEATTIQETMDNNQQYIQQQPVVEDNVDKEQQELLEMFTNPKIDDSILNNLEAIAQGEIIKPSRQDEPSVFEDTDASNNVVRRGQYIAPEIEIDHDNNSLDINVTNTQRPLNRPLNRALNAPIKKSIKKEFDTIDEYEKVKRKNSIDVPINISIDVPEPAHIELIREMYEDNKVEYLEYIAKKYIFDNIAKNTKMIEKLIVEELNNWYNNEMGIEDGKPGPTIEETIEEVEETEPISQEDIEKINWYNTFIIENEDIYNQALKDIIEFNDDDLIKRMQNMINDYKNTLDEDGETEEA